MRAVDDIPDQLMADIQQTYSRPRALIRSWQNRWLRIWASGSVGDNHEYALYVTDGITPRAARQLVALLRLTIEVLEEHAESGAVSSGVGAMPNVPDGGTQMSDGRPDDEKGRALVL